MTCINLIPAHRIERRQAGVRLGRWCVGCTVYCAAVWASCVVYTAVYDRTGEDLSDETAATKARVAESNGAIASVRSQLTEARRKLDASLAVTMQPDWSVLLALVASSREKQVVLNRCQVHEDEAGSPGGPGVRTYEVRIQGLGETQSAVSRFVLRLERLAMFDRVQVIKIHRVPVRDSEAIAFELACALGGGVEQ